MSKIQNPGLSLLDIGPIYELVAIPGREQSLRVQGLSAETLFALVLRFPELEALLNGLGVRREAIPKVAPATMAAIIVAATQPDMIGDPEAEAIAKALPVELQFDICDAMARLSFRSGFGPFVQRLLEFVDALGSLAATKVQATTSAQQSKALSVTDSPLALSGV
jgi:hypothetical protein